MVDIQLSYSSKEVEKALKDILRKMPGGVATLLRNIVGDYQRFFTQQRLSGRPGLYRRTGSLARSVTTKLSGAGINIAGGRLRNIAASVGFLDNRPAMIARVHELGTVGAGGILPDIVPRKGKWLWWRPLRGDRAFSTQGTGWVRAKRVAIPPRLKFFDTFFGTAFQRMMNSRVTEAAKRAVAGA